MTSGSMRHAAATALLGLVAVAALSGCDKPTPEISGPTVYGTYDGVSGPPVVATVTYDPGDGHDESCRLDFYRVKDGARDLVGQSAVRVQGKSATFTEPWPGVARPGAYQIHADCLGTESTGYIGALIAKRMQRVDWTPVVEIMTVSGDAVTGWSFVPSVPATASGGGPVAYAVIQSVGAANCSVVGNSSPPVIAVQGGGVCTVRARATETETDLRAETSVTFGIAYSAFPSQPPVPPPAPNPEPSESAPPTEQPPP